MATYLQLQQEPVWGAQFVPANMTQHLINPLRTRYQMGPALIGAPGDNNHLRGRHRSRNWCLTSRYCTNRTYGTTDGRDKRGEENWYRALDIGITGKTLYDACRRLDAAVRAGRLPGLAEWFGTFDGHVVVGWFEGRPGSSDTSHLTHMHVGWWTEAANDAAQMKLAYQIITGEDAMGVNDDWNSAAIARSLAQGTDSVDQVLIVDPAPAKTAPVPNQTVVMLKQLVADVEELKTRPQVEVDAAALAAALIADPAFAAMLKQQAFEGAQQAERE